jgi:hypothetical protein
LRVMWVMWAEWVDVRAEGRVEDASGARAVARREMRR